MDGKGQAEELLLVDAPSAGKDGNDDGMLWLLFEGWLLYRQPIVGVDHVLQIQIPLFDQHREIYSFLCSQKSRSSEVLHRSVT